MAYPAKVNQGAVVTDGASAVLTSLSAPSGHATVRCAPGGQRAERLSLLDRGLQGPLPRRCGCGGKGLCIRTAAEQAASMKCPWLRV